MATLTYDPAHSEFKDGGGNVVIPSSLDTLVFGPNGGQSYSFTVPDGLDVAQIQITSGDARVEVPSGSTLNASVSVSGGGRLILGTSLGGSGTATLNGSLNVVSNNDRTMVFAYGNVIITGSAGNSVNFSGTLGATVPQAFYVSGASNVSFNVPVNITSGTPQNFLGISPSGSITLTQNLTTAGLQSILANGYNWGVVNVTGTVENTGATLDLSSRNVHYQGGTINHGTVIASTGAQLTSANLDNVTLLKTLNFDPGIFDAFSNGLTGSKDPTILNVPAADIGFGSGTVTDTIINLSKNSLFYGFFGVGQVNLTFNSGSVINALGPATIAFDSSQANTFTLQGALNLLPGASPYSVFLSNVAGTTQFAVGSSVTIDSNANLQIASMLDNEAAIAIAGGTLDLTQAPTTLGTIDFDAANGTLQIGDVGSGFFAPTGTLLDFSNSDRLVFHGATNGAAAHVGLSGNTLQVFDQNGTLDGTFTLQRSDAQVYTIGNFVFGSSSSGMTLGLTGVAAETTPLLTAGAAASFVTGGTATILDPGLTLSDATSSTIASATVAIVDFNPGDLLNFANQSGIVGSYDATAGILTLSGVASVVNYQTALRSISYSVSANTDPTDGGTYPTRTVTWSVSDGSATSPLAASTLTTTFVGPSINASGTVTAAGATPITLDGTLVVADPTSVTLNRALVLVSSGWFPNSGDILSVSTAGTAITANYDPTSEVMTLNGIDTLADYQSVLRSLAFSTTGGDPSNGGSNPTRTITWALDDGVTFSANATSTVNALCFLPGTMIATSTGEIPVEQLAPGDAVLTLSGQVRSIVWIGNGRVMVPRGHRNAATPVIVRKSALADNVPHVDLHLTKGHSLYLDGALIPVEFLVNHHSILWDDGAREVTVFHIELESHDVLLANGAPAESYRDDGNRWLFQNAGAAQDLAKREPCAPVLTGGPLVDAVWQRLLQRVAPTLPTLTGDSDLHLLVDGEPMQAGWSDATTQVFRLRATPRVPVRIVSRSAAPQELGIARDPRRLGVALRRIVLRQGTRFRTIAMTDAMLVDGFHPYEPATRQRWTDGDATLPTSLFAGFGGKLEIVLHRGSSTQYRVDAIVSRAA